MQKSNEVIELAKNIDDFKYNTYRLAIPPDDRFGISANYLEDEF